jgi:hypothetical protein
MKRPNLVEMSQSRLVDRFVDICLAQGEALLEDDLKKFSRLFEQMRAIVEELKARPGDQRRALLSLYEHPNLQVRLKAAKNTLAVAPDAAREVLRTIVDSGEYPQAMEAGMSLWNLERGTFKPT